MTAFDPWLDDGPLTRDTLDTTVRAVQDTLDVVAVLRHRYGVQVEEAGERWRTECVLPSLVPGFAGTCAQQDATEHNGRETPRNLWVSEGETTRVWRCHSCRRHGDVIDLLEHVERLVRNPGQVVSLRAVRLAAKLAGVDYIMDGRKVEGDDEWSPSASAGASLLRTDRQPRAPKAAAPTVEFSRARAINSLVCSRWQAHLKSQAGTAARKELKRRHVTDEQVERYRIGYAPAGWRDLSTTLPKGVQANAEVLGLLGRARQGSLYDRQRDRLIFPYCEPARGDRPAAITGFAGRTMSADPKTPKWMNSNNVAGVWEKGSALIGLYQASQRSRANPGRAAVGEGMFEALAFDRIEAPCVGLVSAEFTEAYVAVLTDVLGATRVTIAFDGDSAGRRATVNAASVLFAAGFDLSEVDVIDCPDGNDPDELPPDELRLAWAEPMSLLAFGLKHASVVDDSSKFGLLSIAPSELADELRRAWKVSEAALAKFQRRTSTADHGPITDLIASLLRAPEACRAISRTEVAELLHSQPALQRRAALLEFAETETEPQALPPEQRRAWVLARRAFLAAAERTHDFADPFADGGTADAFRAWFQRGEELRAQVKALGQWL
jgi:hypothetical protein